jgi:hypothetical protein
MNVKMGLLFYLSFFAFKRVQVKKYPPNTVALALGGFRVLKELFTIYTSLAAELLRNECFAASDAFGRKQLPFHFAESQHKIHILFSLWHRNSLSQP